jgi:hypothetical protein
MRGSIRILIRYFSRLRGNPRLIMSEKGDFLFFGVFVLWGVQGSCFFTFF